MALDVLHPGFTYNAYLLSNLAVARSDLCLTG